MECKNMHENDWKLWYTVSQRICFNRLLAVFTLQRWKERLFPFGQNEFTRVTWQPVSDASWCRIETQLHCIVLCMKTYLPTAVERRKMETILPCLKYIGHHLPGCFLFGKCYKQDFLTFLPFYDAYCIHML